MSRIEAVIPTFNAPSERLAQAIKSCLACADVGRVVVVDDGSEPPVDSGGEAMPKVALVRRSNKGPSAARNAGAREAKADFVLFLDDDDEAIPEGVAAMLALAEEHNAAAVVAARFNVMPGGNAVRKDVPAEWARRKIPDPGDVFRPIALFGASGVLVHRRVFEQDIYFDERLWHGEDREFLRRVASKGSVVVSPEPALRVRIHEGADNLSGAKHMSRRVRDHLILLDRYRDQKSQYHLREQSAWLVNAAAKARVDRDAWNGLVAAMNERGWIVPLKARLRRMIKGSAK